MNCLSMVRKDTELSEQLQLDVSALASQKLDTDWRECSDRQVCFWEHAPVINSWLSTLRALTGKNIGENRSQSAMQK